MTVKVYSNTNSGAPVLTGLAGSGITLLDAVLVNGYGSVSVTSITRSGNVATVTTTTPHGLSTFDIALIGGANETEYNGEFEITVLTDSMFTYTVSGSPTSPATGTITSRRAPAGFSKAFTGSNTAAYRSNDVTTNRHYWQIRDDASGAGGGREMIMRAWETMTSVTTGTTPFPSTSFTTNGFYMAKSTTADATARPWLIITDGVMVYWWIHQNSTTAIGFTNASGIFTCGFGDAISANPDDTFLTIMVGSIAENSANPSGGLVSATTTYPPIAYALPTHANDVVYVCKDITGTTRSIQNFLFTQTGTTNLGSTQPLSLMHYPDMGLYLAPITLVQRNPTCIRGMMPGMYASYHGIIHQPGDIIDEIRHLPGRRLRWCPATGISNAVGGTYVDITGPWR